MNDARRGGERQSRRRREAEEQRSMPAYEVFWRALRPVFTWAAALLIVIGVVGYGVSWGMEELFAPVDAADTTAVRVEIKRGSSVSTIGRQLVEQDLIRNKGVFQYYTEFLGMGGKLKAGTYDLRRSMTIDEIIHEISMGDGGQQVMKFTVIEGMNIEEMAQSLVRQNVLSDPKRFLALCKTGEEFDDYDFVKTVIDMGQAERRYVLEGYLFPDTYEIYVGASEETIIRKMLDKMREVYNVHYLSRAENFALTEGGTTRKFSMDEVLTLASMIEKEAKTADFDKVSAVFHNRLNNDQRLESCVTVQYALKMKRLVLTSDDISVDSPYNTYLFAGLPLGPVASPGENSIRAALYPNEEMLKEGYLFFCSKDPETGELQFSKTLAEHEAAADEFRPLWRAFDEKNKESNGT